MFSKNERMCVCVCERERVDVSFVIICLRAVKLKVILTALAHSRGTCIDLHVVFMRGGSIMEKSSTMTNVCVFYCGL